MVVAACVLLFGMLTCLTCLYLLRDRVAKAQRYAVTLRNNEGAFIALCVEKHRDRWVFEDVRLLPNNPGGPVLKAADGRVHVPRRNILYYQEMMETANVAE